MFSDTTNPIYSVYLYTENQSNIYLLIFHALLASIYVLCLFFPFVIPPMKTTRLLLAPGLPYKGM